MRSKTKYNVSLAELKAVFGNAGLGEVVNFSPLGKGMYNAVYKVETDKKTYAIKIAPLPGIKVMTYEKSMLSTEVFWYKTMAEKTSINVPAIYAVDLSRTIIPSEYVIMNYIDGVTVAELKKSPDDIDIIKKSLYKNISQIHKVPSEKFGYIQNGLHDNWYDALRSFVTNCLTDLKNVGRRSRRGEKLLALVDKYADLLKKVKGCMVNYDIWDLNIMAKRDGKTLTLTWIDPERGFYGDPLFDFVCIDIMKMSLRAKSKAIDDYNAMSNENIAVDRESEIRFAFALGYMALIQETEKFYRYRPIDFGWWFDVFSSKMYYSSCFKLIKANK